MKKILILGSSGFIGKKLVSQLLENTNYELHLLQRKKPSIKNKRVKYFIGSYTDEKLLNRALNNVDLVIHLIMNTSPKVSNKNPVADLEDNLLPTIRLLDLMVKKGIKKIIYPSSGCSVYGNVKTLAKETAALNPSSSYSIVKTTIERYLLLYQLLHGLEPLIIRVAVLYGPGYGKVSVHGLITTVLSKLYHNEQIDIWGDGTTIRDFLYIDDLSNFFLKAINNFKAGIYNVGSSKGYSINEIISLAEKLTNKKAKTKHIKQFAGDLNKIVLNISLAKKDFSWKPRVNIEKGMMQCWSSFSR